jgi:hypothetical protein
MNDITTTTAAYVATVSRDTLAKPGLDWRYSLARNGLTISAQGSFAVASEAEAFCRRRILREVSKRNDGVYSVHITTRGH